MVCRTRDLIGLGAIPRKGVKSLKIDDSRNRMFMYRLGGMTGGGYYSLKAKHHCQVELQRWTSAPEPAAGLVAALALRRKTIAMRGRTNVRIQMGRSRMAQRTTALALMSCTNASPAIGAGKLFALICFVRTSEHTVGHLADAKCDQQSPCICSSPIQRNLRMRFTNNTCPHPASTCGHVDAARRLGISRISCPARVQGREDDPRWPRMHGSDDDWPRDSRRDA